MSSRPTLYCTCLCSLWLTQTASDKRHHVWTISLCLRHVSTRSLHTSPWHDFPVRSFCVWGPLVSWWGKTSQALLILALNLLVFLKWTLFSSRWFWFSWLFPSIVTSLCITIGKVGLRFFKSLIITGSLSGNKAAMNQISTFCFHFLFKQTSCKSWKSKEILKNGQSICYLFDSYASFWGGVWIQTWAALKYCCITSWAEITPNSRARFSQKETHIRRTLWHVVFFLFFFRQTNQEKITFCLRPASVSATLSWEIRGFRARILKSQINCWKIRRAYCSTFLTVFLVVLTDADRQWPTGVRWKCQVNNVLWERREVEHFIWTFFFRGFFFAV